MIYKRCSRCGARILSGSTCPCIKDRHKEYDRYSRDQRSKQFYNSKQWKATKENILRLDGGIDVYAYMTTGQLISANTIHHIIPLREDWKRATDPSNLISLSHSSHSSIEYIYSRSESDKKEMQRKLSQMLKQFRMKIEQGGI